jgi:hypothetical protein
MSATQSEETLGSVSEFVKRDRRVTWIGDMNRRRGTILEQGSAAPTSPWSLEITRQLQQFFRGGLLVRAFERQLYRMPVQFRKV